MYKLLVADNSYLVREGLKSLLQSMPSFEMAEVSDRKQLSEALQKSSSAVLVIDPVTFEMSEQQIADLKNKFPGVQVLAISSLLSKKDISAYLEAGVTGYLLKDCDRDEICEAIESTRKGERFLCGKIADVLVGGHEQAAPVSAPRKLSCDGFVVSEREVEIIKLIAIGLSNKQIADKLHLSLHTVNTHRKNILQKLKVNNTAGVVMFAVRNHLLTEELHAN